MIRREFQEYLDKLELKSDEVKEYWSLYDRIYEPNSPLTYNQKANLLLSELRKMK
jgi:hypothetical protein|tara:strand:+ start:4 stop:168 length:165 start_codon:yes stop_codon:yes gene_type:complete